MSSNVVLEARHLTKRFGGLMALNDVSFQVHAGEIFGAIGPNGAGKTTLFSCLVGAYAPTAGEIWLRGARIDGMSNDAVVHRGMVRTHQIPRPFRDMSVAENVGVGACFGRRPQHPAAAAGRIQEILEFCGLSHRSQAPARSLTIGELKRLEICRALATEPDVILLDEVMGGLNPVEMDGAMDLIRRIRASGKTVVLIEHHMRAVANLCDRVLVLNFGIRLAEGAPRAVLSDPRVVTAYLGEQAGRAMESAEA